MQLLMLRSSNKLYTHTQVRQQELEQEFKVFPNPHGPVPVFRHHLRRLQEGQGGSLLRSLLWQLYCWHGSHLHCKEGTSFYAHNYNTCTVSSKHIMHD